MEHSSQCAMDIADAAKELFIKYYSWFENVRVVTVRAINLIPDSMPTQITFFEEDEKSENAGGQ